MEIKIGFPGNQKVTAIFQDFTVETDQPIESGGNGSAPDPFSLFLSSIGTCTGIYILRFCQERNLPTDNLSLTLTTQYNDKIKLIETIDIKIKIGQSFPEKYKKTLINVAKLCNVKRHLEQPPSLHITID